MENKPAIIVSGNKNNMQPWYEENASVPWKSSPTLRTPSAAPVTHEQRMAKQTGGNGTSSGPCRQKRARPLHRILRT